MNPEAQQALQEAMQRRGMNPGMQQQAAQPQQQPIQPPGNAGAVMTAPSGGESDLKTPEEEEKLIIVKALADRLKFYSKAAEAQNNLA